MQTTLRTATTRADFVALRRMQDDMAIWDAEQSRALGFPSEMVGESYYAEDAAELQTTFTAPRCRMLLLHHDGTDAGSAGFTPFTPEMAEVQKVWLSPALRGAGLGARLLDGLMQAMRAEEYRDACLETATFMQSAIALYERHGFVRGEPFRPAPAGLEHLSVFMRASL